jgi:RNA recognition motif-containing protein
MTTIYVGNLPFTATEDEVRALFERHGKVESVKLINDRETGRPRGFAFVDMGAGEAQNAIQQTNGFQMGGRPLRRGPSPRAAGAVVGAAVRVAGNFSHRLSSDVSAETSVTGMAPLALDQGMR